MADSVTLKVNAVKLKPAGSDTPVPICAVAAEKTEDMVAKIEAKGTEVRNSIPDDYSSLTNEVNDLKEDLTDLTNVSLDGFSKINPSIINNTIYSNAFPNGYTDNSYTSYYYPAKKGNVFYVDSGAIGGLYGLVTYLTMDFHYLGTFGAGDTGFKHKEIITVPDSDDIAYVCVSFVTSIQDRVGVYDRKPSDYYKNGMTYGGVNYDGQIFLKKKRNNTEDLCVLIEPTIGNLLYGFSHIFKVENSGPLNTDVANSVSRDLLSIPTDIFSPYIVQATTNIDGDMPSGYAEQFTGGSHQYNNTSSGSTPTAKTENVKVYADNIELNNEFRFANELKVEFDNLIQGNNTMKADGSGRAILKEHWTITFTENNIECHNEIIALEPIKISRYYGLQTYSLSNLWYLIGGRVTPFTNSNDNGTSNNKKCNSVKCVSDNLTIECEIDNNYGIGTMLYSDSVDYSMSKIGLKTYYSAIMDDIYLTTNDRMYIKGRYKLK